MWLAMRLECSRGAASVLLWGAVFFACPLLALDPAKALSQYDCRSWTRQQGLPASAVNAVIQAKDGFLWVGTQKGLVRYDGIEFKTIPLPQTPLLRNQIISCLAPAADGGLWFGVAGSGFGAYHQATGFSLVTNESWVSVQMLTTAVRETSDGALWVCSRAGTARRISADTNRSLFLGELPDGTALFEDSRQRVWVGTADEGLFYWKGGSLARFPDDSLKAAAVLAMAEDPAGRLWMGTRAGLRCYDAQFRPVEIPPLYTQVRALLADRHGALWIGTTGDGLVRYQEGRYTSLLKPGGLANNFVTSLCEDREGSLWIGTRQGLTQLSDVKFPLFTENEGLFGGDVHGLAADAHFGIWIATSRGFCRFDGHSATNIVSEAGFSNHYLKRVFPARDGDIYVINGGKKIEVVSQGKVVARFQHTNGWPSAFAEDRDGVIAAIGGGLFRVNRQRLERFAFKEANPPAFYWIRNLFTCPDGSLLVASANGIFRIKDGAFRQWSMPEGLKNPDMSFVCEDHQGVIWAGSSDGIARVDDHQVRCFTREDGLPDNFILSILPDVQGWFWVHCSLGLFRVSRESLDRGARGGGPALDCIVYDGPEAVKTIDTAEVEFTACQTGDGRLWFPMTQGVVMVDPANLATNPVAPVVRIESARVDGWECVGKGRPTAPPGHGDLQIQYAATSFIASRRVGFRRWLEGYEPQWVDAGVQRTAHYTNLKPGSYRFHVQACNSDRIWSPVGDSIEVILRPHFHQTVWFGVLCGGLGVAAVSGGIARILRRQRRKHRDLELANEQLEALIRERTGQLIEASRRAGMAEVATTVLHNVGNVLNSVNVSATLVRQKVTVADAARLGKVVAFLRPYGEDPARLQADPAKLRQLITYLETLTGVLTVEKTELLKELDCLSGNVEHIKEIVAMQQAHARVGGVQETVPPAALFEDALRIHAAAYERHGISVVREFAPIASMNVDKHKTLQILVNLLDNAKHACKAAPPAARLVKVRLSLAATSRARFEVIDQGVGIAREDLTRIFCYGFTTRKDGHGFGLHSAALAATEMGGSLEAHSDGPGRGATFTLELPL